MYEFKFIEEDYVPLVKEFWRIYENDFYKVIAHYKCDENHNPIEIFDEENPPKIHTMPKDRGIIPNITYALKTVESTDRSFVRVFINFERSVAFRDMRNEEDEWLDAYYTVFELDKLVRELYPGYKILNDEDFS